MRSHYCGAVTEELLDQEVTLCGWVNRRRDHGGVIFIDLRDREGLVQVVFDPDRAEIFETAEHVRNEYVLRVTGRVRLRPEGAANAELTSGKIEILGLDLQVLNAAETPPFQLDDTGVHDDLRLQYRYIDLRRDEMKDRMRMRSQVTSYVRKHLEAEGYWDIETPMLTKATPEGARDYLVPSRTHQGSFFALPQSPQLFKQLLMMSGMDRYYQIVRCFRDEDLRADRQPEFTQIDIETTFMDENAVMEAMEELIRGLFKSVLDVDLPNPFPRMDHSEAMLRYGSDKPDLRIPLELVDLADVMKDVEFKVFSGPANDADGRIVVLRAPGGAQLSRKQIDQYTEYVGRYGAKGLAWIKVNDVAGGRDGLQSPIVKFLPDDVLTAIIEKTGTQSGDILFFGAGQTNVVNESIGALRVKLGHDLEMVDDSWQPLFVVNFPMFEKTSDGNWTALHHPFTAPSFDSAEALKADPGGALSRAYDMVLNGTELGGGSERIYKMDMQKAVFEILGISDEEAEEKFGFLLNALKYGCPPHAGLAFGLDRLVMLMSGASSIRDVMAFPKTQSAACLLTSAPAAVSNKQLRELNLKLRKVESKEASKQQKHPKIMSAAIQPYTLLDDDDCESRILAAREKLGERLVILGHHYQRDEVFQHANFTGDSLKLSRQAASSKADYIVFCGVHFMAEVADILSRPEQVAILPDLSAGCAMADMANLQNVERAWQELSEVLNPDEKITPVTYINSAADLKGFCGEHGGIVCTSTNARHVLEWSFGQREKVLFFPDQHLGRNTGFTMGIPLSEMVVWDFDKPQGGLTVEEIQQAKIILWKGFCSVHQMFQPEQIDNFKQKYPETKIISHPESPFEVCQKSDYIGSTEYIIKTIADAEPNTRWLVATELNLVNRLHEQSKSEGKNVHFMSPNVCMCSTMFRIDPQHLAWVLENLVDGHVVNQVSVPADVAKQAKLALDRMLDVSP